MRSTSRNGDIMEKTSNPNRLKSTDFYALLAGLAIAGIHFFAAFLFSPLSEKFPAVHFNSFSVRDMIQIALIAPSVMLFAILSCLTSQMFLSSTVIYVSSSFFYGLTGTLFMTKRKILRQIGVFLLAWLILSNFATWLILVAMD